MRGCDLDSTLAKVLHRKPLVAHPNQPPEAIARLMLTNQVQQIPIVDTRRRVVGLHVWGQMTQLPSRPNLFVIMAGGEGKRLRPYTKNLPKPLIKLNGKPILEHIINKAKREGFKNFIITVHYLGKMIEKYFGNGKRYGVNISYLWEKKPLGTAGSVRLINPFPKEPLLITNGDVLAKFQYANLLDFHNRHKSCATMGILSHEWRNQYGVVKTKGSRIIGFEEKPVVRSFINAGIYVLNPKACQLIPRKNRYEMPELFEKLQKKKYLTLAYPLHESWTDIGNPEDLLAAKNLKVYEDLDI